MQAGPSDDEDTIADINVTPFIDVALVLLIVFMVAAPLATVEVPVNLPASSAPQTERPADPIVISLDDKGQTYLKDQPIALDELAAALRALQIAPSPLPVHVQADVAVNYGLVMQVLDALRQGGFTSVALVGREVVQ